MKWLKKFRVWWVFCACITCVSDAKGGPTSTDALFSTPTGNVYVTAASVDVYERPDKQSPVVATLPIGAEVEFRGTDRQCADPYCEPGKPSMKAQVAGQGKVEWVRFRSGALNWQNELGGGPGDYWAPASAFGRDPPRLDALISMYDSTPKQNLLERRKWAERAIALAPLNQEAEQRLVATLTEMGDESAIAGAQRLFAEYQAHRPVVAPGENPLILIYDHGTLMPFAEIVNGGIRPWHTNSSAHYAFYNRRQFYFLYSRGHRKSTLATTVRYICNGAGCPPSVPVSIIETPSIQQDQGGIATNVLLPEGSSPVPGITDEQVAIVAKMMAARIQSQYSGEARKVMLEKLVRGKGWAAAGRLSPDGKVFLLGDVVVGSPDVNSYRSDERALYGQLFMIMEEQAHGTFAARYLGLPMSQSACQYFSHADFDGDGTDEIVLSCFNGEMPNSYMLLKRINGQWNINF